MRAQACKESASPGSLEVAVGDRTRRAQSEQAKTGHGDRMSRPADGLEQIVAEAIPTGDERAVETAVGCCVLP